MREGLAGLRCRRIVPGIPIVLAMTVAATAAGCSGHGARPSSRTRDKPLPSVSSVAVLRRPAACASVLVLRRGRVVARQSAGLAGRPAGRELFDIGSAAKSITAAAVLLLFQEGRLDIAAPIGRYLSGVPAADRTVTLAELLSHTSGLPENFASDQQKLTRASAVRMILALPRRPAGRFRYSNAGYTLLAVIVARVAHEPYRAFVRHRLLAPAGMTSTGWYGDTPARTTPVDGHARGTDTGPAGTQAPASWATLGAGGMTSTAADMGRWLAAITSHSILSPATTRLMFTPRAAIGRSGASAAYGWVVASTPSGPIRLVGGDTDYGYTSDLRILPRHSLATVALSCSTAVPAAQIGPELQRAYAR